MHKAFKVYTSNTDVQAHSSTSLIGSIIVQPLTFIYIVCSDNLQDLSYGCMSLPMRYLVSFQNYQNIFHTEASRNIQLKSVAICGVIMVDTDAKTG